MKRVILCLTFTILIFSLFACGMSPGEKNGGVLSKEQVLKMEPNADLVEYEGAVYKTSIDWVDEMELTKDEQVAEVTEGMATHLDVGTPIFIVKERDDILVVMDGANEKRYLIQIGE